MSQPLSCQQIAINRLRRDDFWDIHPFVPQESPFLQSAQSIHFAGLLYLPLVRETSSGLYTFLTGHRCVAFAQAQLKVEKVLCRIVSSNVEDAAVLALLYAEHCRLRPMTGIGQAYFVRLCRSLLTEEAWRKLLARLQIAASAHGLARLEDLLQLELPLQHWLWDGRLTENMARQLLRLEKDDRQELFKLFAHFSLGGNKQRRLLSLLIDLAGRNRLSIRKYLQDPILAGILNQPLSNGPQQAQTLLQLLQEQHSPSLSAREQSFSKWVKELELPAACQVEHSQSFERDEVSLTIRFDNREHLARFLRDGGLGFLEQETR